MSFADLARERYSERRFSDTLIEQEKLDASLEAGRIAPTELRRQFNIPRNIRVVSVMPLGYPSERSHAASLHTRRIPAEEMFFYDSYEKKDE